MRNMVSEKLIQQIMEAYDISFKKIVDVIDTSHGENDLRYHCILDQNYVLKINSSFSITESFLDGMNALIERYHKIGVYAPRLYKNRESRYLSEIVYDGISYHCYLEEYCPFPFARGKEKLYDDLYELKKGMLWHVGKLAYKYTNVELVSHYSMWSLFDLAPYDQLRGMDEKQINFNKLLDCLNTYGYTKEVISLKNTYWLCRDKIKEKYKSLPRCVFQGDLNSSNICLDKNREFKGIIDFNLYGTEVNINCFLNESMYFIEKEDFEHLNEIELFNKMIQIQNELMQVILKEYSLNALEKELLPYYRKVILLSFYPNVQLWIELIKEGVHSEKVINLLQLLRDL